MYMESERVDELGTEVEKGIESGNQSGFGRVILIPKALNPRFQISGRRSEEERGGMRICVVDEEEERRMAAESPTMRVGGWSVPGIDSILSEREVGGWE